MNEYSYLEFREGYKLVSISDWTKFLESCNFSFKMSRIVFRKMNIEELVKRLNYLEITAEKIPKVMTEWIIYFRAEKQNIEELKEILDKVGTVRYVKEQYINEAKKVFGDVILNIEMGCLL